MKPQTKPFVVEIKSSRRLDKNQLKQSRTEAVPNSMAAKPSKAARAQDCQKSGCDR